MLLCKYGLCFTVISVKSPRQVIDALNAEGPNIDLILSEVDLPMAKGLKMLKYIMRKELQRIPVISKLGLEFVFLNHSIISGLISFFMFLGNRHHYFHRLFFSQ